MPGMRYLVYGRVQGVGFRFFVQDEARRLGLAGWVRNRSDGGVEAVATGPAEKLRQLEDRLRVGPAAARVASLHCETLPGAARPAGKTFVIEGDA